MRLDRASRRGFWCSTTGNNPPLKLGLVVLQRVVELVWARRHALRLRQVAAGDERLLRGTSGHSIPVARRSL